MEKYGMEKYGMEKYGMEKYGMEKYGKKPYWIILLSCLTLIGITIDLRIPDTGGSIFYQLRI